MPSVPLSVRGGKSRWLVLGSRLVWFSVPPGLAAKVQGASVPTVKLPIIAALTSGLERFLRVHDLAVAECIPEIIARLATNEDNRTPCVLVLAAAWLASCVVAV